MQAQRKILAVDDDPNNITIIEELLEDSYDLKTATSGQEALVIAQNFQPDIILLDIMMPGMNGYEVCRKLRERYTSEHMKIIMVSARAMASECLEGYDAGADDYITKPFDGDEFTAKIKLYLSLNSPDGVDHMNGEIATAVVDELRIPAVVAKNIVSDALGNIFGAINTQLRYQLEIANDCMDSIESVMNNYHDISEIHQSKIQSRRTIFSIKSVLLEVLDLLKPKVDLRKSELSVNMPVEELLINADRRMISKILENLIGNAIRGTHEGDIINVKINNIQEKIGVNIEVAGPQVESNEVNEGFNRFYQLEKYVAPYKQGEGLVLLISKRLTELHGGRVCIDDKPGGGSVISLEIPACTKTETSTLEPAQSGVGVGSRVCDQPDVTNTELEDTI